MGRLRPGAGAADSAGGGVCAGTGARLVKFKKNEVSGGAGGPGAGTGWFPIVLPVPNPQAQAGAETGGAKNAQEVEGHVG